MLSSITAFFERHIRLNSTRIILFSFFLVILAGTLLLMLPVSGASGEGTDVLTALFTATTSTCVTGLVVVDTFSHWSLFGQFIILLLIQAGGLGVITIYSVGILLLHRRSSFSMNILIHDYFNLDSLSGIISFLKKVVVGTLIVEGTGAIFYAFVFVPKFGLGKGLWTSLFTAVSAFCNAGIDTIGIDSLCAFHGNVLVNLVTTTLVVLGGLGYVVWFDVVNAVKKTWSSKSGLSTVWNRLGEHSKLVITLTVFLLLSGTVGIFLIERNNPLTIGNFSLPDKLLASLFQSMTFRTAGFATIPQQHLKPLSCLLGMLFMFIGGSPIGTAGGVKTVTFFILLINVTSYIQGKEETILRGHRISHKMISKATAIITVSLLFNILFLAILLATGHYPILDACYEVFSATGTVGLSRALTPVLNSAGKITIIMAMFVGRVGPISMALFFSVMHKSSNNIHFAEGRFYIG